MLVKRCDFPLVDREVDVTERCQLVQHETHNHQQDDRLGWELTLSKPSMLGAFASLALGLAAGAVISRSLR